MGQAMVLPLDVQLEVLSCLEPREIGRVAAVSRLCHKADRTPLLWFHVYSRMFRGHLPAPPRFRDIRGGAATALPIKDFDWRTLTIRRAVIDADRFHLVSSELDIRAAPADRRGMVDTYLTGWNRTAPAVLRHQLVPLPLARPLAYVEAWIVGGASVGLVSATRTPRYPREAGHVGWRGGTIGYHGDDGRIYRADQTGRRFGQTFGFDPARVYRNAGSDVPRQPDVVGVGVERGSDGREQAFFTKNAALVGAVPLPDGPKNGRVVRRFFAFALDAEHDYASVNGGSARFLFDLEAYSQQPPHPLRFPRHDPAGMSRFMDSSDSDYVSEPDLYTSGSDSESDSGSGSN